MRRVHGRVVSQVWDRNTRRVPGVLGRRGVVEVVAGSEVVRVVIGDRPRDLERKAREPLGHALHGRLRGVGWEGVFTLQTELERPTAAGPTHHLLRSHCTICPDMAGADTLLAVGEDEGLQGE